MNCTRAEELFSDHREAALPVPLERELQAHLEGCDACDELYRAFQEVVDMLDAATVPAAGDGLTERLVRAMPAHEVARPKTPSPRLVAGASWLAVAAVLAMVLVFRPPELASELSRGTSRTARHVYSFTVGAYHQAERWVEDLNVLRMTVGVAFEDRLDQINEQLRDLEDAGRRSGDQDEQSRERSDYDSRSFS